MAALTFAASWSANAWAFCDGGAPNGVLEAGEECDDGNLVNGDGCTFLCRVEPDCIDDITGRTNVCTANDVSIALVLNQTSFACELGSYVDLQLTGLLQATSAERWDIGLFIDLTGGDARTGSCLQDYLPPPLLESGTCSSTGETCKSVDGCAMVGTCDDGATSCNVDLDCPAPAGGGYCYVSGGACSSDSECFGTGDPCVGSCTGGQTCDGGYDPNSGLGPFYNGEYAEDPADMCGDLAQGEPTYYDLIDQYHNPLTLHLPCVDNDGDGRMDIGSCLSWDNQRSDGSANKPSCLVNTDTAPNTKSKCNCGYQNIGNVYVAGKIIVQKQTDPTGSLQLFDFDNNYGPTFQLADGESNDSGALVPSAISGTIYTVSEVNMPTGWDLTSATCSGVLTDGTPTSHDPASIDLESGETVTCTFVNTIQRGNIIVQKQTDPAGSPQLFGFTTNYGAPFDLTDGTSNDSGPLLPTSEGGTYSVSEGAVADWKMISATCDDGSDPSSIDLAPGETVTCTFVNQQNAYIIVEKQTDPDGSSQLFDFTTDYGPAFQLMDGETNQSGPLDPGTYSVAESPLAGWDLTSATCSDGSDPGAIDLQAGETVTCTFNNMIQRGTIIVDKVTDPAGSPVSFDFTSSYDGTFSLTDAAPPHTVSGLLPTSESGLYSVSENVPAGWELKSATCDDGSDPSAIDLQPGETVTCTFNDEQDAFIIVEKQTDPDGSAQTFDFTTDYGPAFSLSDGGTNMSAALDPGTYSVSEGPTAGWNLTSATCDDGSDPGAISLQAGETVTCTFNNAIERGTIIVDKVTDPVGSPVSFDFTSSYDGSFGLTDTDPPHSVSGLLPTSESGLYSVAENVPAGWRLMSATCDDGSDPSAIDLAPGETVTCTFVDRQDAFITVIKQTDPAGSPQSFLFNTDYNGKSFSLHDGESNTSGVLDPGTYSVAEDTPAGWRLISSTCDDGSDPGAIDLQAGETVTCTFVNREDAFIIVNKHTDPAGSPEVFDFVTDYDGGGFSLSDGGTNQSSVLDPGTYSVAENVPAGWELKSATCSDGSDPSAIDLQAGETVTCDFYDEEDSYIIVEKQTDPDGSAQTFDFTTDYDGGGFTLGDGQSNQSAALDPGTYSVSESPVAGWNLTSATCSDGSDPGAIDLQAGETVTCVFNNAIERGTIIVDKVTDPIGSPVSFDFDSSYDGSFGLTDADPPHSVSGLLPTSESGLYSVAENVPAGWRLMSATCDDGSDPSAIDLQPGETVTCTFYDRQDAFIVVEKYTDPVGSPVSFDFTSSYDGGSFSLSDGQHNTSSVLDPGTYSVAENVPAGWRLMSATCDDGSDPSAIDLQAGETVTCTFYDRQDAFIVVEKYTDPSGSPMLFDFTTDYDGGGFSLGDGGSNTSSVLDPGTYSVAENVPAGWDLISATCDDGSDPSAIDLQAGETVTCTFENRERGYVNLVKYTGGVLDPNYTWNFTLEGPDVSASDSTPPTTLDFGGAALIPGEVYTLCETGIPVSWTVQWSLDVDGNGVFTMPPDQVLPFVGAASGNLYEVYDPTFGQPGAVNDTLCVDFSVDPGATVHFVIDNQMPGGDARTIGYWKNWSTCTGGNQVETAANNGGPAEGYWLLDDLLPQLLGSYNVSTCEQGVAILDKRDYDSGKKRASDAAYGMAAQLLAAHLNLSAGAMSCPAVIDAVTQADQLLADIGFNGSGSYLSSHSKDPDRDTAIYLAGVLDDYNNNVLCSFP